MGKYPKTGKGKDLKTPGEDLFKAFRPCYMRAFADAKDYKKDTGDVIAGTKDATQDSFVSKDEFRLFCVYLIIYGAMFDAFAKIDGGGSGRGASDDKRISSKEWTAGWKGVRSHGFIALASIGTSEQAKEAFSKMDDNGGGVVLLDEWCFFLKAAEVAAGTPVGNLLNLDEAGGVGKDAELSGPAKVNFKDKKSASLAAREAARVAASTPKRSSASPMPTSPPAAPLPPPPEAASNSFGLAVGKSASKDFFDFAACFEPLCAETPEGEKARDEAFLSADPNGNGLCR